MRLIDEETLKKSIEKWLNPDPNADRMVDIDDIAVSVMMEIEEQPTAYDVDKVVAELEKLADKANDKILEAGELQLYYDEGVVVKQYYPTACAQQTMIATYDGRRYHAPTSMFRKVAV